MSTVNLYKIDKFKTKEFYKLVRSKMKEIKTIECNRADSDEPNLYSCTLYLSESDGEKALSWNWILKEFNESSINIASSPKAVLIIEHNYDSIYAVTFGHAFFLVDKFCDRDFGFAYGRKLQYKEIKTTTLTTLGLRRNKVVNTYINYNELEIDSGESFAKLKAKEVLPDGFGLYKSSIEIGTSICFNIDNNSLDTIIDLICHVEEAIKIKADKCKIPVFSKINDKELITKLEEMLRAQIKSGQAIINISELDIIGVTEIFNNNDSVFKLRFKGHEKEISVLNAESISEFCEENHIDYYSNVLNIKVVSYYNGESVDTQLIHDIIDFILDDEKILLSRGVWYRYNDDYLEYLRDSLAEIETIYDPKFDFSNLIHDRYIDDLFIDLKEDSKYKGLNKEQIREKIKRAYYAERTFNLLRERDDGYSCFDRKCKDVGKESIEVMDLYKDGIMYAVKIGNSSSKLCYAIDQSLTALKLYRKGMFPDVPTITAASIWLVLETKVHIEDNNGIPVLDKLNMLMLKNRLDQWKKEVRLMGIKPIVRINYRN